MQDNGKLWAVGIVLLAILAGAPLFRGCGGYPEVSRETYEYATALYAICNRRDEARLETFSTMLGEARRAGDVTQREAGWLADIVGQAREGEWEQATLNARRILQDQVEPRP